MAVEERLEGPVGDLRDLLGSQPQAQVVGLPGGQPEQGGAQDQDRQKRECGIDDEDAAR